MDFKIVFIVVIFLVGLTNIEAGRRGGGGGRRGGSGILRNLSYIICFFLKINFTNIFYICQVALEAFLDPATKIQDLLGQFLVEVKRRTIILNLPIQNNNMVAMLEDQIPIQNNSTTMLEEQIIIIEIILEEEVGITRGITGILDTEVPIIEVDTVETGMKLN